MDEFVPVYYSRFHCIASACRHTCCAGWEIDIDEETAAYYAQVPGAFGEELRRGMVTGEDGTSFVLTAEEKCPFLDGEGLCRIYRRLGEGHLCQICRDHPRYRNRFSSWTETGLGMCCEEAARVILTEKEKAVWVPLGGQGRMRPAGRRERDFLAFRDRAAGILWDRGLPLERRLTLLEEGGLSVPTGPVDRWRDRFLSLERLEESWGDLLRDRLGQERKPVPGWDLPLEQAAAAFLQRHLPGALEDGCLRERCALAVLLTRLLSALFAMEEHPGMEALADLARRLSSEIEYSDSNIPCLVEMICAQEK